MRPWRQLMVLVLVPLAFVTCNDWLTVDSCLDQGGRYDQQNRRCDYGARVGERDMDPRAVLFGGVLVAVGGLLVASRLQRTRRSDP